MIVKIHLTIFAVTSGMYVKAFRSVSFVAKNKGSVVIDDVNLSSDASLSTAEDCAVPPVTQRDVVVVECVPDFAEKIHR